MNDFSLFAASGSQLSDHCRLPPALLFLRSASLMQQKALPDLSPGRAFLYAEPQPPHPDRRADHTQTGDRATKSTRPRASANCRRRHRHQHKPSTSAAANSTRGATRPAGAGHSRPQAGRSHSRRRKQRPGSRGRNPPEKRERRLRRTGGHHGEPEQLARGRAGHTTSNSKHKKHHRLPQNEKGREARTGRDTRAFPRCRPGFRQARPPLAALALALPGGSPAGIPPAGGVSFVLCGAGR